MTEQIEGLDISQWGGPLDAATIACWKGQGVEQVIVQYSSLMTQHLDALQGFGLSIEGYVYLYWGKSPWNQTPADRTRAAIQMAGGRIDRLWLDCEDSTNPYQEAQLQECVQVCRDAGMPCGIYTGRWWWVPQTNDSQAFRDLPLWHAEYATPHFDSFQSYGGWPRPLAWQYAGSVTLCGHSVDRNVFEAASVPVPAPEPIAVLDGIGIHMSNGTHQQIWPVTGPVERD